MTNLDSIFRRRQWQPTPVLLPVKSHGWRSLLGCSPWGREESAKTERIHFHFSLLCIGEGNGNPLQSSCLENPRDGGAWWAAIYGVTQSQTQLKWLSSSSGSNDLFKNHIAKYRHNVRYWKLELQHNNFELRLLSREIFLDYLSGLNIITNALIRRMQETSGSVEGHVMAS